MIAPGTMQRALEPTANPAWVVDADGYNELREATLELRFALSSGSLGVKGTGAFGKGRVGSFRRTRISRGCSTRPARSPPLRSLSKPPGCRSGSCCLADLWCITR